MHEMRRHRNHRAIGQQEIRFATKFFDAGKDIIPSAAVEPGRMLAQLVKNLIHLECGRNSLDQNRRAHGALRNAKRILRKLESVVPDARFEVALHFRQVKIRAAPACDQFTGVVKKEETKIEERARNRLAIDEQMLLEQMPATRPNE